jgi:hypothetical protein
MKEEHDEYIRIANELKKETEGKVNLYKTGTIKNAALNLFDFTTKFISVEPILEDESIWIMESTNGAIVFFEPYEGEIHKYDVKSMYPSILSNNNVLCPIKRGDFKKFTEEEFNNLKFYPTGIYRCFIERSEDPKINRLFRFNYFCKYTNISLNHAKDLGLKINIICDDDNNALLYARNKCMTCYEVFKRYCDYLFPLKEKKIKGAKLLLNIISGLIGEIDKKDIIVDDSIEDGIVEIDNKYTLLSQKPSRTEQKTINRVVNKEKYFKTDFARLKPFMLAKARFVISSYIKPYNEFVVKCNTDSMISTTKLDVETGGDKMGNLVYEGFFHKVKISSNAKEVFL